MRSAAFFSHSSQSSRRRVLRTPMKSCTSPFHLYSLPRFSLAHPHYPCSSALHVPAAETFHPVRFLRLPHPTFIHLSLHLQSVHSLLSATRRVRCECRSAVTPLSHSHHGALSPSVSMPCQYVFTLKRCISSSAAPCAFHLLTHSHHSASHHREHTPADDTAHGFVFAVIASLPPRLVVPHALGSRLCPLCSSSRSSLVALHCHSRIANYFSLIRSYTDSVDAGHCAIFIFRCSMEAPNES